MVSWSSIRLLLILAAVHGWHMIQLDYVFAYPQAPVEREIYMETPQGFEMADVSKSKKDYVLNLHRMYTAKNRPEEYGINTSSIV